jgi:hypothetical protein
MRKLRITNYEWLCCNGKKGLCCSGIRNGSNLGSRCKRLYNPSDLGHNFKCTPQKLYFSFFFRYFDAVALVSD